MSVTDIPLLIFYGTIKCFMFGDKWSAIGLGVVLIGGFGSPGLFSKLGNRLFFFSTFPESAESRARAGVKFRFDYFSFACYDYTGLDY